MIIKNKSMGNNIAFGMVLKPISKEAHSIGDMALQGAEKGLKKLADKVDIEIIPSTNPTIKLKTLTVKVTKIGEKDGDIVHISQDPLGYLRNDEQQKVVPRFTTEIILNTAKTLKQKVLGLLK